MEFLLWLFSPVFYYIAVFFSDVTDVCLFHAKSNIFDDLFPKEKYPKLHKYFILDSDWWKRKYVDDDPTKGRKKWMGIIIPPMFFDAWHGFKVLRQWAYYSAAFAIAFPFLVSSFSILQVLGIYFLAGLVYAAISAWCHATWYAKLLRDPIELKLK